MNYGFAKLKNIPQIDQKITTKKISQHKAKIQAVCVCKKPETWRFNPDTQDLPEFVASENKKIEGKKRFKK